MKLWSQKSILACVLCSSALVFTGCRRSSSPTPAPPITPPPPRDDFQIVRPTPDVPNGAAKGFNMSAPMLPDPKITPGDVLEVGVRDIAVPGYSKKVRNVSSSVKKKAYLEYGITKRLPGEYEVDHLISLQLGGSNSLRNLWPQSYQTQPWNAYIKDALENELHARVVDGSMDLKTAQRMIATNWIAAYQKIFKTKLPLAKHLRDESGHRLVNSG